MIKSDILAILNTQRFQAYDLMVMIGIFYVDNSLPSLGADRIGQVAKKSPLKNSIFIIDESTKEKKYAACFYKKSIVCDTLGVG